MCYRGGEKGLIRRNCEANLHTDISDRVRERAYAEFSHSGSISKRFKTTLVKLEQFKQMDITRHSAKENAFRRSGSCLRET